MSRYMKLGKIQSNKDNIETQRADSCQDASEWKVKIPTEKYLLNYVFLILSLYLLFQDCMWFLCFVFCVLRYCIDCVIDFCVHFVIFVFCFILFLIFVFCVILFQIFVFCVLRYPLCDFCVLFILFLIFVFCVLCYPLCDFCVRNLSPSASVCVVTLPTLHNLADISGRHSAFVFVNFLFVFVDISAFVFVNLLVFVNLFVFVFVDISAFVFVNLFLYLYLCGWLCSVVPK